MYSGTSFASLFFFAGDIGGQMGLFIGASILTILELIDYLYEVKNEYLLCFYGHLCYSSKIEWLAGKISFFTQRYHAHKDVF